MAAHARRTPGIRSRLHAGRTRATRLREPRNGRRLSQHPCLRGAAVASWRGNRPPPVFRRAGFPCCRRRRASAGQRHHDRLRAGRHLLRTRSFGGEAFEPVEPRAGLSRDGRRIAAPAQARYLRAALTPAMSGSRDRTAPVLVVGGGIGGMAAALALSQLGFRVEIFEQSPEIGEIGAGLQLGPNGFAAMDALGVGERARRRAVFTDDLVMMDAIDDSEIARIPVGEAFRRRFNNPYAVIHRADIHQSLFEEVELVPDVQVRTSTRIVRVDVDGEGVRLIDAGGGVHDGAAVIGCDGVHSVVRQRLIGDGHRVSGHVVYRALVPQSDMPADLRWNAAAIWVGPNCHLVHYPLRGGEQYNIVVTFHSRQQEAWGVREGSRDEVMSYFTEI